jgi:Phosphoribulokinase / Uridine kinase family
VSALVASAAEQIVAWTLTRPATLGARRLICVDGPAGSGKTTLGLALERAARDRLTRPGLPTDRPAGRPAVRLLHMDDVYEGWSGLEAALVRVAHDIVGPLRDGEPGRYRRYDWAREHLAEERVVDPVDVLVIEGVGSGAAAYDDAITCLVWVETPPDLRLRRGIERDGEQMREHWVAWREQESQVLGHERTHDRADVVLDGTAGNVLRFV